MFGSSTSLRLVLCFCLVLFWPKSFQRGCCNSLDPVDLFATNCTFQIEWFSKQGFVNQHNISTSKEAKDRCIVIWRYFQQKRLRCRCHIPCDVVNLEQKAGLTLFNRKIKFVILLCGFFNLGDLFSKQFFEGFFQITILKYQNEFHYTIFLTSVTEFCWTRPSLPYITLSFYFNALTTYSA